MTIRGQNLTLALVGVSILVVTLTGRYLRYVKPCLWPWLATSGILLVVLATAATVWERRNRDSHSHQHAHGNQLAWVLIVPVVMLTVVAPPPLDGRVAAPAAATDPNRHPFPPLPTGPAPTIPLPALLQRIAADSTGSLHDRLVTVTGFTMKDGDSVDLARVIIICCAADAQLARIRLAGPAAKVAAALDDTSWIEVEGVVSETFSVPSAVAYSASPTLEVSKVVSIDPPTDPYA